MLAIYEVARDMLRKLGKIARLVDRMDKDLARQMRRAGNSVVLNLREGSMSQGGNRNARYWNAAGSANEVLGCLDCAEDLEYVSSIDPTVRPALERIVGTLVRIVKP